MKTQLSALHRSQTFLRIFIFTLVTVMIWVGLTLFRTQEETGISPKLLKLAEPLNPNINVDVLSRIEQKRGFSDEDLADFPVYTISVDKSGAEQLVIFTGADKAKKAAQSALLVPEASPTPPPDQTEPQSSPQEGTPAIETPAQ